VAALARRGSRLCLCILLKWRWLSFLSPRPLIPSTPQECPPFTVFSSPTQTSCARPPIQTHNLRPWALWEKEKDIFLSLSFFRPGTERNTRRDREDSEIPSRPVYSLLSLSPAHRRESLSLLLRPSRSVTLPHTASHSLILSLSVQQFHSIHPKVSRRCVSLSCRVFQRVQRKAHRRAPLLADRGPRTCVRRIQASTIIVTFVGDDARNDRGRYGERDESTAGVRQLGELCSFNFSKFMYLHDYRFTEKFNKHIINLVQNEIYRV